MRKEVFAEPGGYTIDEFQVTEWHKKEGDKVSKGEILLTYESDKASLDLEAPESGVLVEINPGDGGWFRRPESQPSGNWSATVCWIETEEESSGGTGYYGEQPEEKHPEPPKEELKPEREPEKPVEDQKHAVIVLPAVPHENRNEDKTFVQASPYVRAVACDKGIDLTKIKGSGPNSRVVFSDLVPFLEQKPVKPVEPERPRAKTENENFIVEPLSAANKAMAHNMELSRCIPHAGSEKRVDFRKIIRSLLLWKYNELETISEKDRAKYLRLEIIVIEGLLRALEGNYYRHNSVYGCEHFDFEGVKIFRDINLGIAFDDGPRLSVPVLQKMRGAGYAEIAERYDELQKKMGEKSLKADDYKDLTFTFNNVGAIGGDNGDSIIPHGTSAICSLHAVEKDGESSLYGIANLNIKFDHRAHKGRESVGLIIAVKKFIEQTDFVEHVLKAHRSRS